MSKETLTFAHQFIATPQITDEMKRLYFGDQPTLYFDPKTHECNFGLDTFDEKTEEFVPCKIIIYQGFTLKSQPATIVEFPDKSRAYFVDNQKLSLREKN